MIGLDLLFGFVFFPSRPVPCAELLSLSSRITGVDSGNPRNTSRDGLADVVPFRFLPAHFSPLTGENFPLRLLRIARVSRIITDSPDGEEICHGAPPFI